jgi:hypothetical protein
MEVSSDKFIDPPWGSQLLKTVMRKLPFMRWMGRPAELVILLTK